MNALLRRTTPERFEVRAVWHLEEGYTVSQSAPLFDKQPMVDRVPNEWGVYEVNGQNVEDYAERGDAEKHAGELNGVFA